MGKGFQIMKKSSSHVSFMPSLQLVKLLIKSGSITVEIVPEEQSRLIDDSHIRKFLPSQHCPKFLQIPEALT